MTARKPFLHPEGLRSDQKVCNTCRFIKPKEEFYNNKTMKDGKDYRCIPCFLAYQKEKNKRKAKQSTPVKPTLTSMVNLEPLKEEGYYYSGHSKPQPSKAGYQAVSRDEAKLLAVLPDQRPLSVQFVDAGHYLLNLAHITCIDTSTEGMLEIELVSAEVDTKTGVQTPRRFLFDGAEAKRLHTLFRAMVNQSFVAVSEELNKLNNELVYTRLQVDEQKERTTQAEAATAELRQRIKSMLGE